ncbi:MAG: DegT/DnrJ/EryC1/StrS family aminotransferase [Nitrospinales bacterium]
MIKLTIPSIELDDLEAVKEVLESGSLVQGERVAAFEKAVADYVGTKHAVAVSNCTSALHISLLALNVRPGDLVIVAAYSWLSTANVIELCGAQPVFVDIRSDTFNMDPNCLEATLNRLMSINETGSRVKAILPVHTFGQIADMPEIQDLANRYNLPVIEDAACALGAALHGKQAGSWGILGCFSFHPRKTITTGEGGIITTNDPQLARKLRALRNHGLDPDSLTPDFIMPGFNYRMTEFQAAMGITQMSKLDRIISNRRKLAESYNQLLEKVNLQTPYLSSGSLPVYQSYVVLLPENLKTKREKIISYLRKKRIEATIGTWNMPMTKYFSVKYNYQLIDFPKTQKVSNLSVTLPLYEFMIRNEQQIVIEGINNIVS